jgi:putative ABC transport system permease protein
VRAAGYPVVTTTPIVNMRISSINHWGMAALTDTSDPDGVKRSTWALRREYRSTYRDTLVSSERLTAGRWLGRRAGAPPPAAVRRGADALPWVSFEQDVARELRLRLGDTVTWDVQGVRIPTRVASFREVNWARFEPNFFAVFDPRALEQAPKQFVILSEVPTADAVARVQRSVVERYPNVSSIDLTLILSTIQGIIDRVTVAVRFLAVFSLAMGLPVLFTAVSATRRERVREGVLLKTLGATRGQIRRIMLAEYALLGTLGSLTGMLLSFGGAWALVKYVFDGQFAPAWLPAITIAGVMLAVTLGIGLLTGRDAFAETPMAALREA